MRSSTTATLGADPAVPADLRVSDINKVVIAAFGALLIVLFNSA